MSIFKKKDNLKSGVPISEGVYLRNINMPQRENRVYSLLLKGVMVYLIVMGQTGCILSCVGISYNVAAVNIGILMGSLFCAMLYYTKIWENVGYILLFIFMLFVAVSLRNYISSGFFAIVNELSERAAIFFGTAVIQGFKERLSDRYMTVTVSVIYIGWVNAILFNVIISRRMKYFVAVILTMVVLFVPFYLEKEPDTIYTVMLISGLILTYVLRVVGRYEVTTDDMVYKISDEKYRSYKRYGRYKDKRIKRRTITGVRYVYDFRSMAVLIAGIIILSAVISAVFGLFLPKTRYASLRKSGTWRESTLEQAENLYKLGIWGIFNLYPNTGGLSSGQLGGVNSVQLDYETDLSVTLVPYSTEPVYLRSFTGVTYVPFSNKWDRLTLSLLSGSYKEDETYRVVGYDGSVTTHTGDAPVDEQTSTEIGSAQKSIYKSISSKDGKIDKKVAKCRITVKNDGGPIGVYLPYYMSADMGADVYTIDPGKSKTMTCYPLFDATPKDKKRIHDEIARITEGKKSGNMRSVSVGSGAAEDDFMPWLSIPQENVSVIKDFIDKSGLDKDATVDKLTEDIRSYFQKNIPYSYQPGITPYKKDFINYFLAENKKGYCAHFASAATLIFRGLGKPARYVEGYVITSEDIATDGRAISDADIDSMYDGYDPLGSLNAVEVEVSDAAAHAWVEVYDEDIGGWVVADVTPYSMEAMPAGNFLSRLIGLLSGEDDGGDASAESSQADRADIISTEGAPDFMDSVGWAVGMFFATVFGIFAFVIFIRVVFDKVRYAIVYRRADMSARLVMDFRRYYEKATHSLVHGMNIRDDVDKLVSMGCIDVSEDEKDKLTETISYAAFSDHEITKDTYDKVMGMMIKH